METALPTYTIKFDFTSSDQLAILSTLQQQGYSLLVFQSIDSLQDAQPTPIWLVLPFTNIFGVFTLSFTPQYKVYVAHTGASAVARAAANGVGDSFAMSNVVPLGTSLVFQQNGSFTVGTQSVPANAIQVYNAATAGGQVLTTGLAASANGSYNPFNATSIAPTITVQMTPRSNLIFGVAQLDLVEGVVSENTFAPGAQIRLSAGQGLTYTLSIEADTYAVVSTGSTSCLPVTSQVMGQLASGS